MFKTLLVLISFGMAPGTTTWASEPCYPTLFFSYSPLYDKTVCPSEEKPVPVAWAFETQQRQSEFGQLWESEAPAIFKQLSTDFGKGFLRKELTATLTACDASFSYSDPLVIRVLPFLKSFRQSRPNFPVFPDRAFVVIVFHELLHIWLAENFDFEKSPLYLKYKAQGETQVVLNHLQLMAIQRKIYGELGKSEELKFMDWYYSGIKDPAYPRAWAIVNSEGYLAFTGEVRRLNPWP